VLKKASENIKIPVTKKQDDENSNIIDTVTEVLRKDADKPELPKPELSKPVLPEPNYSEPDVRKEAYIPAEEGNSGNEGQEDGFDLFGAINNMF